MLRSRFGNDGKGNNRFMINIMNNVGPLIGTHIMSMWSMNIFKSVIKIFVMKIFHLYVGKYFYGATQTPEERLDYYWSS